jgi:predicted ester cyclase
MTAMPGFDPQFADLDDYIRVITAQIWEGRQIETIADYYSADCAVLTPSGATTGIAAVIDGTRSTLDQFPDRRLLAEDVIQAGNAQSGFLSSHRIISTMTHSGPGVFGEPTGKVVQVRTIADCVCKDNRIVHEWLVRDQAAIAKAIGVTPQALAQRWLETKTTPVLPLPKPAAPLWWQNPMSDEPIALQYADTIKRSLTQTSSDLSLYDEAVSSFGPGNSVYYGHAQVQQLYQDYAGSFNQCRFETESLCFMPASSETGRPPRVALRWRLTGKHSASGRFGTGNLAPVEILGINHAEFVRVNGRWSIHREWLLIDEVALWMQLLLHELQGSKTKLGTSTVPG